MKLKVSLSVLNDQGQRFMGKGPYELMLGVKELGSIRQAALRMDMSYAKAHRILKDLESNLGFPIMERHIGGSVRGGAFLTREGELLLRHYAVLVERLNVVAQDCFAEFSACLSKEVHSAQTDADGQEEAL